jgi:hypothetical protein
MASWNVLDPQWQAASNAHERKIKSRGQRPFTFIVVLMTLFQLAVAARRVRSTSSEQCRGRPAASWPQQLKQSARCSRLRLSLCLRCGPCDLCNKPCNLKMMQPEPKGGVMHLQVACGQS